MNMFICGTNKDKVVCLSYNEDMNDKPDDNSDD